MQTAILCWAAALITVIPRHHTAKSPVVRLLQYHVRSEYQAEFRKALGDYVNTAVNATGNIMAEAYYEETDSTKLWIIERWTDQRSLEKNGESNAANAIVGLMKNEVLLMESWM